MKKIVVIMQNRNFLGAQIVHIPVLLELKKMYKESKIIIFSKHKVSNILLDLGIVDKLIIEENQFKTFVKYLSINPQITINLRKKSILWILINSFFNFNSRIGFKTFISNLFFTKTFKYNSKIYRAQNYLNLIEKNLEVESFDKVERILIIPGAGGNEKIWNIENYVELANKLKNLYNGFEVAFLLGLKEQNLIQSIENNHFALYFNKEITFVKNIIQTSSIVIANDCGPSHFAQISDVKTFILYTNEKGDANDVISEWFNKMGNKFYIIGKEYENMNSLTAENVFELIKAKYYEM
jgi:ADP-heptose:LPS heptosyltransferase